MKNANMKKVFAFALTLTMAVGMLAGCGSQKEETKEPESSVVESSSKDVASEESSVAASEELEPVTLKWIYCFGESEGSADVIEAFNAKLAEVLPNTTVEFDFVTEYSTNWPLLVAGGEKMDIAWGGYDTPFQQDVVDGNLLGLSDLIQEYAPNLVEEMEIWQEAYESCMLDGEIWAIPCIQPTVKESQQFIYHPIIEPYLDLEAMEAELRSNNKLTSKMLDIIEEAIQAGIDDGALTLGDASWHIEDAMVKGGGMLGYLYLGPENNNIFFDPEAENPVPLHMWEVPEYQMMVERYAKWYDMGWVTESQVLSQLPDGSEPTLRFFEAYNANWSGCDEHGIKDFNTEGSKTMMTNRPEEGYVGVSVFGSAASYLTIPYTSENPERAMMLLNILHDEPGTIGNDLMNMLCYGFEKNSEEAKEYGWYNYTAEEIDGQMQVVMEEGKESKHSMINWALGNTFKIMHDGGVLTTAAAKEYALNFYTDVYPSLKRTAIAGMSVDYSGLQMELDAMSTVFQEFDSQFRTGCGGVAEVEGLFEKALSKLKEAGLNKVKSEVQAQIDAYIAK